MRAVLRGGEAPLSGTFRRRRTCVGRARQGIVTGLGDVVRHVHDEQLGETTAVRADDIPQEGESTVLPRSVRPPITVFAHPGITIGSVDIVGTRPRCVGGTRDDHAKSHTVVIPGMGVWDGHAACQRRNADIAMIPIGPVRTSQHMVFVGETHPIPIPTEYVNVRSATQGTMCIRSNNVARVQVARRTRRAYVDQHASPVPRAVLPVGRG